MVRKKEKKKKIKVRKSCLKAGVCYLIIYLFISAFYLSKIPKFAGVINETVTDNT